MQDFLHGITFPVVQDDIDLLDLENCLYLAVTMQVWTPRAPAKTRKTRYAPFNVARFDEKAMLDWDFNFDGSAEYRLDREQERFYESK